MTHLEATRHNPAFPCPSHILERLTLVPVQFISFNGQRQEGQILIDRDLEADIQKIFSLMLKEQFPLQSVVPIAHPQFEWDDERSMQANNTHAFNYRHIAGTDKLSDHAYGRAIDINPLLNPFIKGTTVQPVGARYNPLHPGAITANSMLVQAFKDCGWHWGGDWSDRKDYQHFAKPLAI